MFDIQSALAQECRREPHSIGVKVGIGIGVESIPIPIPTPIMPGHHPPAYLPFISMILSASSLRQ